MKNLINYEQMLVLALICVSFISLHVYGIQDAKQDTQPIIQDATKLSEPSEQWKAGYYDVVNYLLGSVDQPISSVQYTLDAVRNVSAIDIDLLPQKTKEEIEIRKDKILDWEDVFKPAKFEDTVKSLALNAKNLDLNRACQAAIENLKKRIQDITLLRNTRESWMKIQEGNVTYLTGENDKLNSELKKANEGLKYNTSLINHYNRIIKSVDERIARARTDLGQDRLRLQELKNQLAQDSQKLVDYTTTLAAFTDAQDGLKTAYGNYTQRSHKKSTCQDFMSKYYAYFKAKNDVQAHIRALNIGKTERRLELSFSEQLEGPANAIAKKCGIDDKLMPKPLPITKGEFFTAIVDEDLNIIKRAIKEGIDVNEPDLLKRTPLFTAVSWCKPSTVELLLKAPKINVNAYSVVIAKGTEGQKEDLKYTPLLQVVSGIELCSEEHALQMAAMLLSAGADKTLKTQGMPAGFFGRDQNLTALQLVNPKYEKVRALLGKDLSKEDLAKLLQTF